MAQDCPRDVFIWPNWAPQRCNFALNLRFGEAFGDLEDRTIESLRHDMFHHLPPLN